MSDSLPKIRPEGDDTPSDLRLKRRLAQDCAKMADAGMHEHALVALWEMGMGRKVDGTPIENLPERTRAQALAAYLRAMSAPVPSGGVTINQDNRRQLAVQLPEGWLNDPAKREAMLRLTEQSLNGSS